MFWTIGVILIILWLPGLFSGYTMGGVIHVLLGYRHRSIVGPLRSGTKMRLEIRALGSEGKALGN
jgi:hypothetical protein